jgi:predicted alpha/beta hydrolase family esterase
VAASTNDPFGEQIAAQNLALDIGAAFSDAGEAGHINVESGHGPWPEGILRFAGFLKMLG